MSNYYSELHNTYNLVISEFSKVYPQSDETLLGQMDIYSCNCALYIWHKFNVPIDKCIKGVNEIYTDKMGKPEYDEIFVEGIMSRISSNEYSVPYPSFLEQIIEYDKKKNTDLSSRLVACFQLMDINYALIDGYIEPEEASLIESLQRKLVSLCNANGIAPVRSKIRLKDYVRQDDDVDLIVNAENAKASVQSKNTTIETADTKILNINNNHSASDKSAIDRLDSLVGLEKAKKEIHEVSDFASVQLARKRQGLPVSEVSFHLVFSGNPGTGKTTVARLIAEIYKDLGIVSKGHLTEVSAKDLVAGYVGQTAIKTGDVINKALGGVLFIDEAYTLLDKSGQGFGQEAIDTLLKEMEDHRGDFVVIVAGYDDLMQDFINSNPGLKSRFNKYIHFDDYTPDEMMQIFDMLCHDGAYSVSNDAKEKIKNYFSTIANTTDDDFANGRTVRNIFEKVISKQASRIATTKEKTKELLSTIEVEDVINGIGEQTEKAEESIEDVLQELKSLIGLDAVKEEIAELVYIVQNQQRRKSQGLKVPSMSLHLVFMGNPGTGKTTVARLIARIYKCLGLLSKGQLIETDRSGLVAGYVGQTAIKTQDVIQTAIGGVLFIDEAYTLANGGVNDFGQEAIDTLLKVMEDQRDDLVVIVAGYDDLMQDFINSNPGLESRFNRYIHFENYTYEQMLSIFQELCKKNQYILSDDAVKSLRKYFSETDISSIGNGRGARNLFEKVVTQQAKRIEKTSLDDVDLLQITKEDVEGALTR